MTAEFLFQASQENKAKYSTFYEVDLEVTQHSFATETSLPIFNEGEHRPRPLITPNY